MNSIDVRNIVFDLGGVVFYWRPESIIAQAFERPEDRARLQADVFTHRDWIDLDRGVINLRDVSQRLAARTGLDIQDVKYLLELVPRSLTPIPSTLALMYRLKRQGYRLYCLSNMGHFTFDYLKDRYSFWNVFEGVVISAHLRMVKPEPEIYQHLLDTYGLEPAATVFIDDLAPNLEAAAAFGIKTIHFQSPQQCEPQLEAMLGRGRPAGGVNHSKVQS